MKRDGPGLLLRDILKGDDPGIAAAVETIVHTAPDVLLITSFDWDLGNAALGAFAAQLGAAGQTYPYLFALRPNAGLPSGLDLDGDGRTGGRADAQGYGRFLGHGGMALLSRLPIAESEVRDFTEMLWIDLPEANLPEIDGKPFPSDAAQKIQRVSSTGHWDVPVILPGDKRLHLLAFSVTPPVFDGPEDRNGLRNSDEIALWQRYLDGALAQAPPDAPVIVLGNANLDPSDGDGRHDAIANLLGDPRLQDAKPNSPGGTEAARVQGGVNADQTGDPGLDTADWGDATGPGNLRVSYVLPDARLTVQRAGVFWPETTDALRPLIEAEGGARHRLIWVDIDLPP